MPLNFRKPGHCIGLLSPKVLAGVAVELVGTVPAVPDPVALGRGHDLLPLVAALKVWKQTVEFVGAVETMGGSVASVPAIDAAHLVQAMECDH